MRDNTKEFYIKAVGMSLLYIKKIGKDETTPLMTLIIIMTTFIIKVGFVLDWYSRHLHTSFFELFG